MANSNSTSRTSNRSCLLSFATGATAATGAVPLPVDVGCWPATTGVWPVPGSVVVAGGTLMLPPPVVVGGTAAPPAPVSPIVVGGGGVELPDEPEESDDVGVSDWNELEPGLSKSTTKGAVRSLPVPGSVPT